MSKSTIEAYLKGLICLIDEQGWIVQGVDKSLCKPGKYSQSYVYSVGRPYRQKPMVELLVLGQPVQTGAKLINDVLKLVFDAKITLIDDFVFTRLANFPIKLKRLEPSQVQATCAINKRINPEFDCIEFFQLIWPDPKGTYPGEEGFDTRFVGHQDIDMLERTISSSTAN